MKYQPPFVPGATPGAPGIFNADPDASYVNGDPQTGTEGSYFPNKALEDPQREIVNALTAAGLTPDHTSLEQLAEALSRHASGGVSCVDSGTTNAYVLAGHDDFVMPTAYFDGMIVRFYPVNTNNAGSTINAFGLGAKVLLGPDGTAVAAGDVVADVLCEATYDTTLNAGAGGFKLSPWSVLLANVSGGVPLYEGREAGRHKIRSLEAGTNITLQLVETGSGSGDYRIRINGAAGAGAGGGSPHENVGSGAQVHKTNDGTYDELRTIKATPSDGITVAQETDEITLKLTSLSAFQILARNDNTTGTPAGIAIAALSAEINPADADELLLSKAGNAGLKKVSFATLRGAGSRTIASGVITWTTAASPIITRGHNLASVSASGSSNETLNVNFTVAASDLYYYVHIWKISGAYTNGNNPSEGAVFDKTTGGFKVDNSPETGLGGLGLVLGFHAIAI